MGPPTPRDSDCDGVPDDRDVCPQRQGLESNAGCPAGIEVVVVTGLPSGVLCPNGLRAASKSHCPGYSLWRNSHTTLTYDSRTHQVSSSDSAAPCGSTVDAGCACGAGKVKVFDEDNDTFHCKPAPPDAGCPEWGSGPNAWEKPGIEVEMEQGNTVAVRSQRRNTRISRIDEHWVK